jgi:hypothetical protein
VLVLTYRRLGVVRIKAADLTVAVAVLVRVLEGLALFTALGAVLPVILLLEKAPPATY